MLPRFLVLFLALYLSQPAWGQASEQENLTDITAQQEQAEREAANLRGQQGTVTRQMDGLQRDLVTTAAQSRAYEQAENTARERLADLEKQERGLLARILEDQQSLSDILAAMQRISRTPPPALLVSPDSINDAVRASILLRSISAALEARSKLLSEELAALDIVRTDIGVQRIEIADNAEQVDLRLRTMQIDLDKKAALSRQLDTKRASQVREAKRLAAEADNLRDLIAAFESSASEITPRLKPALGDPVPRTKPKAGRLSLPIYSPPDSLRFADARGELPLPVFGTMARRFGAKLPGGGTAKGISLSTNRKAQVIAPFPARVEYAGPFNNDNVVILNVGGGYFIVLTGLGQVFTEAGTSVIAGEPLGIMPRSGPRQPVLFMEFRKNGKSVNPKPWIGAALAK